LSHSVKVQIQGREYQLRSQQDPQQVHRVADFVAEQLENVARSGSVDSQDALALTLLNLGGQYLQLKDQGGAQSIELNSRLATLLQKIESGQDPSSIAE